MFRFTATVNNHNNITWNNINILWLRYNMFSMFCNVFVHFGQKKGKILLVFGNKRDLFTVITLPSVLFKKRVLSLQLAESSNLMPTSAMATRWSQCFTFYVGRSFTGGCMLRRVNIHQGATYVCVGDHQLWNNIFLPSIGPDRALLWQVWNGSVLQVNVGL